METFLQKYFSICHNLLAFPYKLEWEPGLKIHFTLNKKSIQFYLWSLTLLLFASHFITIFVALICLSNEYIEKREIVKLAFHSMWTLVSGFIVYFQFLNFHEPQEIVQLANGVVHLRENLESG